MTNANQKQSLVFWPTTSDQNENPRRRSRSDSNKILPSKLRKSEEDLLDKEYLANRSSYPYSRVASK